MERRYAAKPVPNASTTEAALDAMDADELRALIRDIIPRLDESTHAQLVNILVDRAARNSSGWIPVGPSAVVVADIQAFAEMAARVGYAEPSEVDAYLHQGSNAFLGKDYQAASQIFGTLLVPMGRLEIHVGQDEMIDEVLGIDVQACAAQYVVSMYMTATLKNRGQAVLAAIREMQGIVSFWTPLRDMERVTIEVLPEFENFLEQWRAIVEEQAGNKQDSRGGRRLESIPGSLQ